MCHNEQSASLLWCYRKQAAPRPKAVQVEGHLGQKQCKSKAETKLVLAMLRRSLRSLESKLKPCRFGSALGLHCFSSLELSHEPQSKPNAEGKFLLAVC